MPVILRTTDLGRLGYDDALAAQLEAHARVRALPQNVEDAGEVLLVEHPPVITVTRKGARAGNLTATPQQLDALGVQVRETDRGGDVTYHGPGQLVAYPIVDLKRLGLGVHSYIRALEQAIIDTLSPLGVHGTQDPEATGVWVQNPGTPVTPGSTSELAKIAAIGVRVRRWVTLHGLSLNVRPDMSHYGLLVPCGLAGRPVTSLEALLGTDAPSLDGIKPVLIEALAAALAQG